MSIRLRYKLAERLVGLANRLTSDHNGPGFTPQFRAIDSPNKAITGSEWACAAYSYEGLKSLTVQDGPDGFGATATIKWLISDEGWQSVGPEDVDMINESFERESNRQEREESMRIMRGEESNEQI